MSKRKIIMDVDTGTDDSVALVLSMLSDDFDLLGICTVNGNLEVDLTTNNSLRVVECCDFQDKVKVYRGCEFPLVSTLMPFSAQSRYPLPRRKGRKTDQFSVHSDYLPLPEPTITEAKESAVVFLINTLLAAKDNEITIVAVGPMTNIATAIRADIRIIPKIKEIIIMGGGHAISNITSATEFNIWADPEAMEILLQSGCKVTLIPLDATHKATVSMDQVEILSKIDSKPAQMVANVIRSRIESYYIRDEEMSKQNIAPLHDALALCYVSHPEVITKLINCPCHVDISGGHAYGRTIVDIRGKLTVEEPNCYFAMDADKNLFFDWMYSVLTKSAK